MIYDMARRFNEVVVPSPEDLGTMAQPAAVMMITFLVIVAAIALPGLMRR